MFQQIKHLILVDATPIVWTPKGKSEEVSKVKYTFMAPDGSFSEAYEEIPGTWTKDVQTITGWDETKARDFAFGVKLFQGATALKLMPKVPTLDNKKARA